MNLFCFSHQLNNTSPLSLNKFLSLENANIFSFYSLNRNFALTLQAEIKYNNKQLQLWQDI